MKQKRFRTIIELVMEAENPSEAIDIAGEYLRGELDTGVTMECFAKPILNTRTKEKIRVL